MIPWWLLHKERPQPPPWDGGGPWWYALVPLVIFGTVVAIRAWLAR